LVDALVADVGKPRIEAYTTEIAFTINEIDHTLKHLDAWTKPSKVKVPLTFKPGTATLRAEPLGTVCIIAPGTTRCSCCSLRSCPPWPLATPPC